MIYQERTYISRMRAQSRATAETHQLAAAAALFDEGRAQDLNLRPDVKVAVVVKKSDKKQGWLSMPAKEGYLDVVFVYGEPTELRNVYGYLNRIWGDTSPEEEGYQLDFCPAGPKVVQLDDADFPKPMKIKRLSIRDRAYNVPVGKNEPLNKRRDYKVIISFVDFFQQKEWEVVRKVLSAVGNPGKSDIPASFWWFKEATDRAFVYRDSRTVDVCGYPIPFVDIRLESKQRDNGPNGLLAEIKELFSGFRRWYAEKTSVRGISDYVRNSAIGFLQDPKSPNAWDLRQELERQRRKEHGLKDLPPIDQFLKTNEDLRIIGSAIDTCRPGRQSHRLAPFVTIKQGRFIEEEYPEVSADDKDKGTRVLRYYEVLGYDGSFVSDDEIEQAFVPGEI